RVGLLNPQKTDKETMYRLYITQLASPRKSETGAIDIKFNLRFGIPIFVNYGKIAQTISGSATRAPKSIQVALKNASTARVQVMELIVRNADSGHILKREVIQKNIFPHEPSEVWNIPFDARSEKLKVQVVTVPASAELELPVH
ncbi:MAG: hypothetical protein ACNA7Y_00575, partial [Gammaproteobacteria bacterium]